ncbi:hypothetical protein SAMN05216403_12410 [Nitrosospira multiformis ATCC 25196]|uniref:Lipoprotein n=1 Tax=Nitrosospira multiformis (strain ATCC 25196 / NCIMB 11849 / C 71) TaxID=323848 RepID=Q2Y8W8_NITMU|nr:hypothetical protein [Nitrosospira multiformis]ABB74803.1 hypothetical protein Nmul_A1500 [Nitrosospira multiformis ATCC 25196]SEG03503.1 hypothetical protein SAMN05216403_12410 [Nitrosospira multiformis ATCC 25196]
MNISRRIVLGSVIASFALAGCNSPKKSFLGASFPRVAYRDIAERNVPLRLKLSVEFQRNGEHFPEGDIPLKDYANAILGDTRVVVPVIDRAEGEVRVILNNIADSGTVASEAARTRYPLWVIGRTITDAYELSMFITTKEGTISRTGIKQAVHTAIGNMSIPEDVPSFPQDQAFGKVLEQMILQALLEMQQSGELTWMSFPAVVLSGERTHRYFMSGCARQKPEIGKIDSRLLAGLL